MSFLFLKHHSNEFIIFEGFRLEMFILLEQGMLLDYCQVLLHESIFQLNQVLCNKANEKELPFASQFAVSWSLLSDILSLDTLIR